MRLFVRSILIVLLLAATFSQPAWASDNKTAQSVGAQMRLTHLPIDSDGKLQGLLTIDLKPGWITYWKEPGAYGIPPLIAVSGSPRYELSDIRYPFPKKIFKGELLDIGYDAPVSFPFTLVSNASGEYSSFKLNVLIGVCKDICIPFQHEFTIDPSVGDNPVEFASLMLGVTKTLPAAANDTFKVDHFEIAENRTSVDLVLTVPKDTQTIDEVIIAGPQGHAYTLINHAEIKDSRAFVNVDAISLPEDFDGTDATWHAVIRAGNRMIETDLVFPKS